VKDFSRLIDECDSELGRAILKAGREDSSELRKGRVLAAIGVGAAVTMTSKASFAMSAVWKKVFIGSVVAASGVAGLTAYRANQPAPVDRAEVNMGAAVEQARSWQARSPSRSGTAPKTVDELDEVEPASAESGLAEPSRRSTGRGSRGDSAASLSAASLNEEVALLDKARSAVRTGRPNDALARLDEHATRFPKGSLSLEAQVLRVQALAAAGRTEEASRRAKRILSRSPNSVVAQRLRQYVIE
jgi:hypothetical protein